MYSAVLVTKYGVGMNSTGIIRKTLDGLTSGLSCAHLRLDLPGFMPRLEIGRFRFNFPIG
jgi:hypothetical protein